MEKQGISGAQEGEKYVATVCGKGCYKWSWRTPKTQLTQKCQVRYDDDASIFSVQVPGVHQSSWLCVWASDVSHLHTGKGLRMCTGSPFPRICPLGNSTWTRKKRECALPGTQSGWWGTQNTLWHPPTTSVDTSSKEQPFYIFAWCSQRLLKLWASFIQHTHERHLKKCVMFICLNHY